MALPSRHRSDDTSGLLESILRAESEDEVADIVENSTILKQPKNWFPLDDRESNFNVVTNQASTGSKALTELCTNMVDAYLLKQARLQDVDPMGIDAPGSVLEGVRRFAKITGMNRGRLFEVDDDRHLRKFAEKNLVIGVNGGTTMNDDVCFTFVDKGEGQHRRDFKETFLSLKSGHKSKIPFVQGKYNMGSSGVLGYCGRFWFKLIVSRRYSEDAPWGWTLLRRRPKSGTPVVEYFAPSGIVPEYQDERIFPLQRHDGNPDDFVSMTSGTVVKLYSYYFGESPSFRNIRESLDRNLTSTVLPFRMMDYRYPPDAKRGGRRALGIDERTFCGLEYRLMKRESEAGIEDGDESHLPGEEVHIGIEDHPELGIVSVSAIVLDKNPPSWLKRSRDKTRVYHAVNGQVQFKDGRGYLSQTCKLPGIMDRVVIIVDASELSERGHNEVWKGDREAIRENQLGSEYRELVTTMIRKSDFLKELQARLRRQDVDDSTKRAIRGIFEHLISINPSVAQLLQGGDLISGPGKIPEPTPFRGKHDPTYLTLLGRRLRDEGIEVGLKQERHISFETDAVDDFFSRASNRGSISWVGKTLVGSCDANLAFNFGYTLRNGRLAVRIRLVDALVQAGDVFDFAAVMTSDSMAMPVNERIRIRCVDTIHNPPPGPGPKPVPNPKPDRPATFSAPDVRWLTRDGRQVVGRKSDRWSDHYDDFDEHDGGFANQVADVDEDGPAFRYFVNYDNAHLQNKLLSILDESERVATVERFCTGLVLIMMSFEHALGRIDDAEIRASMEDHMQEVRRAVGKGASSIVLALTDDLSGISTSVESVLESEN